MSNRLQPPHGTRILADITLELDSAALRQQVRAALPAPLRRAGAQVELCVAGAHACMAALPANAAPAGPVGLLWNSRAGGRFATAQVLEELCLRGEDVLPFDFLATQPALAAIPLQQAIPALESALYMPWTGDDALRWPRLLELAASDLLRGRHRLMLCGTVEPGDTVHRCRWIALAAARDYA